MQVASNVLYQHVMTSLKSDEIFDVKTSLICLLHRTNMLLYYLLLYFIIFSQYCFKILINNVNKRNYHYYVKSKTMICSKVCHMNDNF